MHMLFFRRMYVSQFIIKHILIMTHDDVNEHIEFDRIHEKLINSWYIRDLSKQLTNYLKHCFKCQLNRIKRNKFYDSFQSILSSFVLFYLLIIDFVLVFFSFYTNINNVMLVTNKFNKRITIVSNKNTWSTSTWAKALLKKFDLADWNLSKIIISNKDPKFLFDLWSNLFSQLKIKLLYFIVYHFLIDDTFERTN